MKPLRKIYKSIRKEIEQERGGRSFFNLEKTYEDGIRECIDDVKKMKIDTPCTDWLLVQNDIVNQIIEFYNSRKILWSLNNIIQ